MNIIENSKRIVIIVVNRMPNNMIAGAYGRTHEHQHADEILANLGVPIQHDLSWVRIKIIVDGWLTTFEKH